MDWSGSERQRSTRRDDCLYPGARPTPRQREYFVPAGTHALTKRVGEDWSPFVTTKDSTFDSVYRETAKSYIFFRVGHLLCVDKNFVDDAPAGSPRKLTEDLDQEYLHICGG